jgi:fructose-bisphosphate aldolase class II
MPFIYGKKLQELFARAKKEGFAIPAVNVTSYSTINAALETAKELGKPIIIQFSHGGAQFIAGKSLDNTNHLASIAGAISGARHIHQMADLYGVEVIIHSDHCAKKLLPWVDGLITEGQKFYTENGFPLFSSHMLDLSLEPLVENLEISQKYLTVLAKMEMHLEIEIGITGGEEDGVNHEGIENKRLYTQPADVALGYEMLNQISPNFTIAASFGNVHGVYAPGNVHLHPEILKNSQDFIAKKYDLNDSKPVNLVFHGGSGSTEAEVKEAVSYGIVKMNLDTDMQWAFWSGVKDYYNQFEPYLQTNLGNPEGEEKPNKKYYDPRAWLRAGEISFKEHLTQIYSWLNHG